MWERIIYIYTICRSAFFFFFFIIIMKCVYTLEMMMKIHGNVGVTLHNPTEGTFYILLTETSKECFPPIKSLASHLYIHTVALSYHMITRKWYISKQENTIFHFYTHRYALRISCQPLTHHVVFFSFSLLLFLYNIFIFY